jgi:probable rRNA maturation factor
LEFINRQRTTRLNVRRLKPIAEAALAELGVAGWDLTFSFVGARKMAALNQIHLGHEGPTDVITFDYSERGARDAERGTGNTLQGEIFICLAVAMAQAREFRTTWPAETVRYLVHALLHLCGYDDLQPAARREMKRHENRLVGRLARQFDFAALAQ